MSDLPDTTPQAPGDATGQQAATELFTKSQIEEIIKKRLSEEQSKYSDYASIKAELDERRKSEMTQAERLEAELKKAQDEIASERKKAAEADLKAMRLQVALKKGIPATSAGRLVGTTEAELEADADAFLSDLKAVGKPTPPELDGAAGAGQRGQPSNLTPEQVALGAKMGVSPDLMQRYKKQ